jgi:hypothetical protein
MSRDAKLAKAKEEKQQAKTKRERKAKAMSTLRLLQPAHKLQAVLFPSLEGRAQDNLVK